MDVFVATVQETKKFGKMFVNLWKADIQDRDGLRVALYKTNMTPTYLTTLADIEECDFSGYERVLTPALTLVHPDGAARFVTNTALCSFTHDGGPVNNTVYLVGALNDNGGTQATATATKTGGVITGISITNAGTLYEGPPRVIVTDSGAGSGAELEAEVTDGTISAINIIDGGAGYNTITITIDPPVDLLGLAKLDTPVAMDALDDEFDTVLEIANQGPEGP